MRPGYRRGANSLSSRTKPLTHFRLNMDMCMQGKRGRPRREQSTTKWTIEGRGDRKMAGESNTRERERERERMIRWTDTHTSKYAAEERS